MTDAELAQLVAMGGQTADMQGELDMQRERARRLRDVRPLESGRVGRVPVSPSPLAQIAQGAQMMMGNMAERDAMSTQKKMNATRQEQMAMLLRMLQAQPQSQQQPAGPGMMPPTGPSNQGMTPPQGFQL